MSAHMLARIVLVIGATLASSSAHARPWGNFGFGAQLQYELSGMHDVTPSTTNMQGGTAEMTAPASRDLVLGGFRVHGFAGGQRFGYHIGAALAAGSTIRDGGFAYDVSLFPVGLAMRFASTSFVTVGAGVGFNGAVGTLNDVTTLPLELRFEVGRGIRVIGRARASYLSGARERKDGGVTLGMADELEAMLGVRLGRAYTDFGMASGNGYFVGATVRELMGARFAGIVLGYSVDMASPVRRSRRAWESCENCD